MDDEDVGACGGGYWPEAFGLTRRRGDRCNHAAGLDFGDASLDQVIADGRLIQALHELGNDLGRGGGDLRERLVRLLVAALQAFEVQHGQSAELAQRDREAHIDHTIHGRSDERDGETVIAERPAQVDVVGVQGLDAWHDRHVVEAIGWPQTVPSWGV